jgi:hypothetical protein
VERRRRIIESGTESGLEFVNLNASRTRAIKLAAGCTTYYRVSDQATGKVYYTTDIDRTDSGGVVFEDAKTATR